MKQVNKTEDRQVLHDLCINVRELVEKSDYVKCEKLIRDAMCEYPHASEPHNLFGILLEIEGDHASAMKHFRAALSLNPTYSPVHHNLELFGTSLSIGSLAFDETDCPEIRKETLATYIGS